MKVLISGVSTRAAAESAARAGFEVTAVDAFGDLDQHPAVRSLSLPRNFGVPFSARAAARVSRGIDCDAVAYLSSFENHPVAVASLAARRVLWGNPPDVLRRVRNPSLVTQVLSDRGFTVPKIRRNDSNGPNDPNDPNVPNDPNDPNDPNVPKGWLIKPLRSGGGRRVRRWNGSRRIPRSYYLQERIDGTAGSIVFVASRGRAVPLGITRQLVGDPVYGASGFQYCGNILASSVDRQFAQGETLIEAACALARAVGEEFGLVGVNGIDFVACDGIPSLVEVNPRWTASMELAEHAFGLSMFGIHAAACERGTLPSFDLTSVLREARSVGKAVVFAQRDVIVGDTREWLADPAVRDVPHPGERIAAGSPVCTVLADGLDSSECYAALARRAEGVYAALASWQCAFA